MKSETARWPGDNRSNMAPSHKFARCCHEKN